MATLPSGAPKDNYKGLLKTNNNTNISASEQQITDGDGNNVGAKATSTKWIATNLKIENAPLDDTVNTALFIDGSGDVKTKQIPDSAFEQFTTFIARASADTSPVTWKPVGNTSADSISVGSGISILSDNTINVANSGTLLDITASMYVNYASASDDITFDLFVQSQNIKSVREKNTTGAAGTTQVNINEVWRTAVNDQEIQIQRTVNAGTPTVDNRSFLKVTVLQDPQ